MIIFEWIIEFFIWLIVDIIGEFFQELFQLSSERKRRKTKKRKYRN